MNNKKLFLSLLLSAFLVTSSVNADVTTIKDIDKSSSYAKNSILYLAEQNIVKGDAKGNFNPQKSISRVELVTMMARVLKLDLTNVPETATFKDIPKSHWAFSYVEAAYKAGIVTGFDTGEFKPNDNITREQMALIFVRSTGLIDKDKVVELNNIINFSDKSKISSWAQKEVDVAIEAGLMTGMASGKFEPKQSASKEQAAVVFERLMKNKDEMKAKFTEAVEDETAAKLVLNGETIKLDNRMVINDGNVFAPIEFFNRYIINYEAGEHSRHATDVKITLASEYATSELTNFWLQVGSKTAVKNQETNPFADLTAVADKQIVLENEPIQIEGITYLPVKEIFGILDIEYNYSNETNEVTVNSDKLGKSAKLYYPLKKLAYYEFVGEMKSRGSWKLTDPATKEYYMESFEMLDKQSDKFTVESYVKETMEGTGMKPEVTEEFSKIIGNKSYEKDFTDNKWVVSEVDGTKGRYVHSNFFDPLFDGEIIKSRDANRILFDNFNRFDIKNNGTVYMGGIPTTKYTINFDIDTIKYTMTDEEYADLKDILVDFLGPTPKYTYTFYVSNNTVVKQIFEVNSEMTGSEPGQVFSYYAYTNVNYNNVGKNVTIAAPPASAIK